jgi:ABC-type transport system involved in multi-copper enzyme maturation permease subunit
MKPIIVIAHLTFREAVRRRVIAAALMIGIIFLIVYSIGFAVLKNEILKTQVEEVYRTIAQKESYNFLHLAGQYTVNFLCIAMAALLSADTLAGEISSGTIQTLVTKPIRRSYVVLGKWLGFASILALYLLLMAGGIILTVWIQAGFLAPNLVNGISLIYLESLLMMSIAVMCSSRFSAMATGAIVFGLYGLAFIGGWIEQFGSFARSQTAIQVGIVSSLISPSEALWRRAAYEMQSPVAGMVGMTPFNTVSVPSPVMVVYAFCYILVLLGLTLWQFNRRDL